MSIAFDRIAGDLLARAIDLLPQWQPEGRRVGNEFKCGSMTGGKGDSCSTNLTTGVGADFATGQKWGDLIDLYAQIHGIGMGEAAKALAPHMVNGHDVTAPRPKQATPVPVDGTPAPSGPPDAQGATALYRYTDRFYVARFDKPDGKTFTPFTWDGVAWRRKAHPKPRPLFGLDALVARPDAPVLVVEGEKCAQAAGEAITAYVVVTWAGGAQATATADWAPLHGRKVDIWPDADEPGRGAAAAIAEQLLSHCPTVRIVDTTDAASVGWDIADALADGWTRAQVLAWGKERIGPVTAPATQPVATVPRGTKEPAGSATTDSGVPAYVLWEQLQLARNERGPYPTEANALRIISAHSAYAGRIWLDEFAQRLMIDTDTGARQFSKTDALQCLAWMQEALQLPKMALSAVNHAAILVGERNKRHPVKNYLESLAWDSHERLPFMIADAFGAEQTEYTAAIGRCWLVAMISRIYSPGGQADNVPVFEGAQGLRKSSALRALVGEEWFMESVRNPIKDPDRFSQSLQGKWLVEIPEIDRVGGRHGSLDDLTGVITIRKDTYRMPYAPTFMDYPRQTILSGTTNKNQWQPDQTGGRRYWPVECGQINMDYITENRDQLFAEALHRYRRGESWWDVPADATRAQQEDRRVADAWESIIEKFITHDPDRSDWQRAEPWWRERPKALDFVTVADVLLNGLGIQIGRWTRGDEMRVASCFIALGYVRRRRLISGKQVWVYIKQSNAAWTSYLRADS